MISPRAKDVFEEARQLAADEQRAYVRERCADDPDAAIQVLILLNDLRAAGAFLNTPAESSASIQPPPTNPAPVRIGHYEIVGLIAEGGMGAVYEARQDSPHRSVALKVLRTGLPTRELAARFRREGELLGALHHPGIAAIYEAGVARPLTVDGPGPEQPFLAMELVRGPTIAAWCARPETAHKERIELMALVCDAVEHAHQHGIVHRDLKPANILVDESAGDAPAPTTTGAARPATQPKVLDFGVARMVSPAGEAHTLQTEPGQVLGTLPYMSPEQVAGSPAAVDRRTDIYALGTVLYEVLSGRQPLQLKNRSFAEAARIIRDEEPSRLATLNTMCRGDLDTIVAKAMSKDPSRRYATAAGLAADLRRHLHDEPIVARPTSAVYQLRKFAKRNKTLVGGVCAVILALTAGVIGTTIFALQADRRAAETQQVVKFQAEMLRIRADIMGHSLRKDLLAEAEQGWRSGSEDVSPDEIARRRAQLDSLLSETNFTDVAINNVNQNIFQDALHRLNTRFADQPLVKAQLLQQVAATMMSMSLFQPAIDMQNEALRILENELGSDDPGTLTAMDQMANLLTGPQRWEESAEYERKALAGWQRTRGENAPETLRSKRWLGQTLQRQWRLEEAEALIREALEGQRRTLGDDSQDTLESMLRLGQILLWRGELGRAEPLLETATPRLRALIREENLHFSLSMLDVLVRLRTEQGRLATAEETSREALSRKSDRLGDDSRETLFTMTQLSETLRQQSLLSDDISARQQRIAEAERWLKIALAGLRRARLDDTVTTALQRLGCLRRNQGRLDDAEKCFKEALDIRRRRTPDNPWVTWPTMLDLADVLARTGDAAKTAEADELQRQYLELHDRFGPRDPWRFRARRNVAGYLHSLGKPSEAAPFAREAVDGFRSTPGASSTDLVKALGTLALIMRDLGKPNEALELFDEIDRAYRDHAEDLGRPLPEYCWFGHADCLMSVGRFHQGERLLLAALSAADDPWLTSRVLEALIKLHDAWHAAEPNAGHDGKADEWRRRRESNREHLRPIASPSAPQFIQYP